MIDLYTWGTPNGRKVSIMLEEVGLAYRVHPVDILKDAQFTAAFLAISPNNKIPAIVDRDCDVTLMESGAILMYLADKCGRFMPQDAAGRWRAMQWLMFQVGGLGPMLGQAHHFLTFNKGASAYAEQRYAAEAARLYGVLDRQLAQREFLADEYSIADIATWPWVARFEWQGIALTDFPNVSRWYCEIAKRPAVQRGYQIPSEDVIPMPDASARKK